MTEAKAQGDSVVHRRTHGTMKNPSEMEELAPESLIQEVMEFNVPLNFFVFRGDIG